MTTVTLRRALDASPDEVWGAFTDADRLAAWFWPARFETRAELDVRDGGRWRVASEPLGMAAGGEYRLVQPGSRLAFGWRWDGGDEQTLVAVTVSPTASGHTELEIEHTGFASAAAALEHETGWNDCLDRLEPYLAGERGA